MTHHLTEAQLYEALTAPAQPSGGPLSETASSSLRWASTEPETTAAAAHLATCPGCQAELATLQASLANFRLATIGLAAATSRRPALETVRRRFVRPAWLTLRPAAFATAAALLTLSVALFHPHPLIITSSTTAPQSPESAQSDEALLNDIQRDLSTSVAPSLAPLAVPTQ